MSLFYDPKTRKTKVWVISVFVIVPIAIVVVLLRCSKTMVQEHKEKTEAAENYDIFKALDSGKVK